MPEIPLTRGVVALVDEEDAYLAEQRWFANPTRNTVYAARDVLIEGKLVRFYLHRVIMNAAPTIEVDHENGNGLDCRRRNLRVATRLQNGRNLRRASNNTSGYKGVHRRAGKRRTAPWVATIAVHKKRFLGCFATPEEAARAYDAAAAELFGDFARVNFPEERR